MTSRPDTHANPPAPGRMTSTEADGHVGDDARDAPTLADQVMQRVARTRRGDRRVSSAATPSDVGQGPAPVPGRGKDDIGRGRGRLRAARAECARLLATLQDVRGDDGSAGAVGSDAS